MFYFVVTKDESKDNSKLLSPKIKQENDGSFKTVTETIFLRESLKRDVDYGIVTEDEWMKIRDQYTLEFKFDKSYSISITFVEPVSGEMITKRLAVYGIEKVYEAIFKVFLSPTIDIHQFEQEYKVISCNEEIDARKSFDMLNQSEDKYLEFTIEKNMCSSTSDNISVSKETLSVDKAKTKQKKNKKNLIPDLSAISFNDFSEVQVPTDTDNKKSPLIPDISNINFDKVIENKFSENSESDESSTDENCEPIIPPIPPNKNIQGLANIGNTCFMNVVLQIIFNISELNHYLLNYPVKNSKYTRIITEYKNMVNDLYSSHKITTSKLKHEIGRYCPICVGTNEQDANEFLTQFLDILHDGLLFSKKVNITTCFNTSEFSSIISKNVFGRSQMVRTCLNCKTKNERWEIYNVLNLTIPREGNYTKVIDRYNINHYPMGNNITEYNLVNKMGISTLINLLKIPSNDYGIFLYTPSNTCAGMVKVGTIKNICGNYYVIYKIDKMKMNVLCKITLKTFFFIYSKTPYDIMITVDSYSEGKILNRIYEQMIAEKLLKPNISLSTFERYIRIELEDTRINTNNQFNVRTCNVVISNYKELLQTLFTVRDTLTIEDCILNYSKDEEIEMKCNLCGKNTQLLNYYFVHETKYLFITLKRFDEQGNKLNTFVNFDEQLKINDVSFELIGIICHIKVGMFYGHYIAYIKKGKGVAGFKDMAGKTNFTTDAEWYCANDSVISKAKIDKKDAYILMYRVIEE